MAVSGQCRILDDELKKMMFFSFRLLYYVINSIKTEKTKKIN